MKWWGWVVIILLAAFVFLSMKLGVMGDYDFATKIRCIKHTRTFSGASLDACIKNGFLRNTGF